MVTQHTKNMMALLPQWMKMARDEESVGAQFLDCFGVEYNDVEQMLSDFQNNFFIGTANVDLIDIVFKIPVANENLFNFDGITEVQLEQEGRMIPVLNAINLRRFYDRFSEPMYLVDAEEGFVYIRLNLDTIADLDYAFDSATINGTKHFEYLIHHIWNPFDEFGYLLGVERLYKERNVLFKERILDVFRNPANSTKQGLLNGLAREFGIAKELVELNDFQEYAFRETLFTANGEPTSLLTSYAKRINEEMAFTWDRMNYGDVKWKSIEKGNIGLKFLPHLWDAHLSMFSKEDYQSGVGDLDDLKVYKPILESSTRPFKAYVGLKGYIESEENVFPEIEFKYKIYAKGKVLNEAYPVETYRYTIKASEIVDLKYKVEGLQRYNYWTDLNFSQQSRYDFKGIPTSVLSTDVLHVPTNKQVMVKAYLETSNKSASPRLETLTVKWKDTADAEHSFTFDSLADFTQNNTRVTTELVDAFVTDDGAVELGYGDFYSMTDSRGAWEEAYYEGVISNGIEILEEGSLTLRLPKAD